MKRRSLFKLAAGLTVFTTCCATLPADAVTYTITDLGVIGPVQTDSASIARGINSSGEVTGNTTISNGDVRAFLYSGGVMHNLGTLASGDETYGYGINDAGVVVGDGDDAFYYANGKITDMGELPGGVDGSGANGINASGEIVGASSVPGGNSVAFLYSGGKMTDLKDLQGDDTSSYSAANAINNSGVIAGTCQILVYDPNTGENNPVTKAMIYSGNTMTELPPLDQTTVAAAYAINSAGEIVGVSGSDAALWTGGNLQLVPMVAGATGSSALGINDAGQIVGAFDTATFGVSHAFVCTNGVSKDLNTMATGGNLAGFEYLAIARGINNSGTIVGEAYRSGPNGGVRGPFAFMAKPSVPTAIPPTPGIGMLTAAQNDPAPGFGTGGGGPAFSVPGPPAIDKNGDVAFRALIKETSKSVPVTSASNAGIWLYVGTVGSLVARTGDPMNPAPVTNDPPFTKLSDPVLSSDGDLAFIGSYAGGTPKVPPTTGIFVRKSGGTLALAWAVGDAAPVTGVSGLSDVVFTGFKELAVENGGGVAFLATVKGKGIGAANNTGVWSTDSKGALQLLALKGTALPGITPAVEATGLTAFKPLSPVGGQSRSIDPVNGYAALLATAKSPSILCFEATRAAGGGYTCGDPVAAGLDPTLTSMAIKSLEEPIVNENGTVSFLATVSATGVTGADDLVLGLVSKTTQSIIARTGDASLQAPDGTGATTAGDLFSGIDNPVLNNGDSYAFIGTLKPGAGDTAKNGGNGSGIWTNFGGTYERLVREGDPAPGTTGTYRAFEQLVLPDVGGPIFTASLSGVPSKDAQGLWAVSGGVPALIVQTGNSLQVHTVTKTVRSFSIFQLPPAVMGQSRSFEATKGYLVYLATFTDGTWGIFSVVSS